MLCYSLLLIGLSVLVQRLAPEAVRTGLMAGLIGGGCCLAWSIAALMGKRGKALAILTLVPVSFVLLSQAVMLWADEAHKAASYRTAALLMTLLFALSVGMLVRIAYAGLGTGPLGSRSLDAGQHAARQSVKTTVGTGGTK